MAPTRSFVDREKQPCRHCGEDTFLPDGVCAICADPPINPTTGRFRCCGGVTPEHFDSCAVGSAIGAARRAIAHAQARGVA